MMGGSGTRADIVGDIMNTTETEGVSRVSPGACYGTPWDADFWVRK